MGLLERLGLKPPRSAAEKRALADELEALPNTVAALREEARREDEATAAAIAALREREREADQLAKEWDDAADSELRVILDADRASRNALRRIFARRQAHERGIHAIRDEAHRLGESTTARNVTYAALRFRLNAALWDERARETKDGDGGRSEDEQNWLEPTRKFLR